MTQTEAGSPAARRAESGRHFAARVIIFSEAPLLLLISIGFFHGGALVGGLLSLAGSIVLVVGALRMRNDPVNPPTPSGAPGRVPWDWTDFLMFWGGGFAAAALIGSMLIPIADLITPGADAAVRRAAETFTAQLSDYGGQLFNIFVLAGLRRNASLRDLGFRGFRWWWIPVAVLAAAAVYVAAGYLQEFNQSLLPHVQNGQCRAVRHDYGNFLFHGPEVVAVLDWEIAQVGQPLLDLGCLAVVAGRHPGEWPSVPNEELFGLYGVEASEMSWYVAMSLYKYAAIFGYNLMLHRRGKRPDPFYELLTTTITGMIDEGIEILR